MGLIPGEFSININILRIADVDTGSVVAIGNNYFYDWRTYAKSNSGFGRINGDRAAITDLLSGIEDPDLIDMINCEPPESKLPGEEGNCLNGAGDER